jgi:SAM-dependent methyltransferase
MTTQSYSTGNSKTFIAFDDTWTVADLGSGHNPHPRADILVDRFLLDNTERSGAPVILPSSKTFVVGDGVAMPFKDKAFDFVVCSHVIEHIEDVDNFCSELNRVSKGGYLECPSKFAEVLRHAPNHRWFVSNKNGRLIISPTPVGYPMGWFGKFFFSLYFYDTRQVIGRDVFSFAHGLPQPFHFIVSKIRKILAKLWIFFKPITYTRFVWHDNFTWEVNKT